MSCPKTSYQLMGILNVTPDSFFDGGKYSGVGSAVSRAEKMIQEGADIIDVGGESSRPGSVPVSEPEEIRRVLPVIKALKKKFPKISISVDTQKSSVAREALQEGAEIINDISALRNDAEMVGTASLFSARVVLMHMRGAPQVMQKSPRYKNTVKEIKEFLAERIQWAVRNGISKKKIWIDPGIGFGKTVKHNIELLSHLDTFLSLGVPVLVGVSRKSFLGWILAGKSGKPLPPEERLEGSIALACWSYLKGASILRVHDVGATKKALRIFMEIQKAA